MVRIAMGDKITHTFFANGYPFEPQSFVTDGRLISG